MKILDVQQGSVEWYRARLGRPSASSFHQIVTPKGKFSTTAIKYAYRLVAERLLNEPMQSVQNVEWMERGKEMEPRAVQQFEWLREVETRPCGFITTDDGRIGCSPDRLVVGQPVGVEIKCCAPWTHLGFLLDGPGDDYKPQVQGQLWVAEIERVDLYHYHDRMPPCLTSTVRDEAYIKLLSDAVLQFADMLDEMEARARALGVFQARADVITPFEREHAETLVGDVANGLMI
jgi:YqaJ-like viral recombinase domain